MLLELLLGGTNQIKKTLQKRFLDPKSVQCSCAKSERTKQMEPILYFQEPAEGLELVILHSTKL